MEELISLYLFQYKKCPLPSLGSLKLNDGHATPLYTERTIAAPVPFIEFTKTEIPAGSFIQFIAAQKNISLEEARNKLHAFCKRLESLDAYAEIKLPCTGKFYVDADGILIFRQTEPDPALTPSVTAERLIHPEASQSMRVGDRETTTAAMTEFYSDAEPAKKDKWWIWALVLTVLAVVTIITYMNDPHRSATFGTAAPVVPASETTTYKSVH